MNLLDYFKTNIHMNKIESFTGDMHDIAVVRYVMVEASKLFYRDYTFFFNKEDVNSRDGIYNSDIDLRDIQNFNIVCKNYCLIIKKILKQNYGIDSELISAFEDRFRHTDLLVKTRQGNNYIVDPLSDLIGMQVGLKTQNFASKEHYDSLYSGKTGNINFLNASQLKEIDDKIGYTSNGIYLDDFLNFLKTKLDNMEEILQKDESISIQLLGRKYDGKKLSDTEKTYLKLRFISKYLNNRKNLNGVVDLLMFSKIIIEKLFTEKEQKQITTSRLWVDQQDIKDESLSSILINKEDRKRGISIKYNGKNFIFSLSPTALEFNDEEWGQIVKENNIYVRPQYQVQLLKYLKNNGADRNIVHNNEFLRMFSEFEKDLLGKGHSLEEIKEHNVRIQDGIIFTQDEDKSFSYQIVNGNLVVKDYKNNLTHTIFYENEGRNISYRTEKILQSKEQLHLYEFDSNGIFELDACEGIEELVAPLKSGKYLSRNALYYESNSYDELAEQRQRLGEILTEDISKKNFVILEYLSNSSAKVYFEELKKKVNNEPHNMLEAQKCFEEDCANIVRFFRNEPLQKLAYNLPKGNTSVLERHIEMDNKQILYMFCSNLKYKQQKHILTPGLGSIFVGPMLKSMYGFDYTNILFSLYSKDEKLRDISTTKDFEHTLSNQRWKTTENELVLIDDNVGSCNTMNTIRKRLAERGKTCKFGTIKYNWKFYDEVKRGELKHPTFDIKQIDFLTILDDPGYWIMRDSIKALKENGGDAYVEVMKQEGLRKEKTPDIQILLQLAEQYSKRANVDLYDTSGENIKKSSAFLCINLKKQILELIREFKSQNLEER